MAQMNFIAVSTLKKYAINMTTTEQLKDVLSENDELKAENALLRECNRACAEWVKQSANQWMHRPRGGWPIELRKAYEAVHDSALPNV